MLRVNKTCINIPLAFLPHLPLVCGRTIVFPNLAVVVGSFAEGTGAWRAFAASPADREALQTSLVISVASVFAAALVGLPRTDESRGHNNNRPPSGGPRWRSS